MPVLLETQRSMRARLLALVPDGGDASSDELFAIYRGTIVTTLANALRLSYPAVLRLVGPEFFEGAARQFLGARLPSSACLNDYGEQFGDFLLQFAPAASVPYLCDVAHLEWAVNRALHGGDAARIDPSRLALLDDKRLPYVSLTAHPGVSLLQLKFPADLIWRAVLDQDTEAMTSIDLQSGPVRILVERDASGVQVRRLDEWAWEFTRSLAMGRPLHAALEALTVPSDEALNALLADHLTSGRFIEFSSTGDADP
jgi:hypothetical protein